jgi:hypothetical protein
MPRLSFNHPHPSSPEEIREAFAHFAASARRAVEQAEADRKHAEFFAKHPATEDDDKGGAE